MYTEENLDYNDYDYQYEDSKDNNGGSSIWTLLLRILIIFLCLLLIIWIVSKFIGGNKKVNNDGVVLNNNLDTMRLAAEKYFFIEDNLPSNEDDSITIGLKEMNDRDLVAEVKDFQNNTCSTSSNESYVTVKKTNIAYELIVKLTCNKEQKEVIYYYDLESKECLSCNGNTYMDGNLVIEDSKDEYEDLTDEENEEIDKLNINCNNWSPWTSIKIDDSLLIVKTRTLYKGYKEVNKTVYGEWSSWSETPVEAKDGIEVETKEEIVSKWSEDKVTTDYITNSEIVKVVSATSTTSDKSCSTSYKEVREKVSASKYFDLNDDNLVIALHDTYYENKTTDGKTKLEKVYDITYKKKKTTCSGGSSVTVYTYQELIQEPVTMYRYRTVEEQSLKDDRIYTEWVEKLEDGYIKTEEKIEYSYKDTTCKG